jgi:hypothetical protein
VDEARDRHDPDRASSLAARRALPRQRAAAARGQADAGRGLPRARLRHAGFVANPNLKQVFAFDRGFDVFFDSPVEDTVTLACIRGTWFGGL